MFVKIAVRHLKHELLYEETPDSIQKRETERDLNRFSRAGFQPADHRPNKQERRQMTRLKGIFND